ncbi:MAG: hypothetical protein II956_04935 [Bacteroidales bacterium]|nr:hypothetical protein [Bacteroidales bacterium]
MQNSGNSLEFETDAISSAKNEGRAEGGKQKALSIARAMKQHGDDLDYIALITGLTKDEIFAL